MKIVYFLFKYWKIIGVVLAVAFGFYINSLLNDRKEKIEKIEKIEKVVVKIDEIKKENNKIDLTFQEIKRENNKKITKEIEKEDDNFEEFEEMINNKIKDYNDEIKKY